MTKNLLVFEGGRWKTKAVGNLERWASLPGGTGHELLATVEIPSETERIRRSSGRQGCAPSTATRVGCRHPLGFRGKGQQERSGGGHFRHVIEAHNFHFRMWIGPGGFEQLYASATGRTFGVRAGPYRVRRRAGLGVPIANVPAIGNGNLNLRAIGIMHDETGDHCARLGTPTTGVEEVQFTGLAVDGDVLNPLGKFPGGRRFTR